MERIGPGECESRSTRITTGTRAVASRLATWLAGGKLQASGGSGIRTREGVAPLHALQACPFVRSGKPPGRFYGTRLDAPGGDEPARGVGTAEATGFEPVRGGQAPNRFRGGPVRPLRHASGR